MAKASKRRNTPKDVVQGTGTLAKKEAEQFEYAHTRDWYSTVHYFNYPDGVNMGKCIQCEHLDATRPSGLNVNIDMVYKQTKRLGIEQDAPFLLYFLNSSLDEIETLVHDAETVEYLNTKGLNIFLYEPICSYDAMKVPDIWRDDLEAWLRAGKHIPHEDLKTHCRNPMVVHNFGFYTEFGNAMRDKKRYRAIELDSILRYVTQNNLTNVHVWSGDYDIEKHYPYYTDKLNLHCDDIFLLTFTYTDGLIPKRAKLLKQKETFAKRFISTNWRYTTSRCITSAVLSTKNSHLTWPYTVELDVVESTPWMCVNRELLKRHPQHYKSIIMGLAKCNAGAPWGIDLEFDGATPVEECWGHVYPQTCKQVSSTSNPVYTNHVETPLWEYYNESFVDIVNESRYAQPTSNVSEKVFQSIQFWTPFVLVAPPHSLQYMKEMGFKTFDKWWDESYDTERDHTLRLMKILDLIEHIDSLSDQECADMYRDMTPTLMHNTETLMRISMDNSMQHRLRKWTDSSMGIQ